MLARAADVAFEAGTVRYGLSRSDEPIRSECFAFQIVRDLLQKSIRVDRVAGGGFEGLAASVQPRKKTIERFHESFS